jgi:hypothetical protein
MKPKWNIYVEKRKKTIRMVFTERRCWKFLIPSPLTIHFFYIGKDDYNRTRDILE